MPSADTNSSAIKPSWADQMDDDHDDHQLNRHANIQFPSVSESIIGDNKVVTEYKINDQGKKVKIIRYYKIEKRRVPKKVATRKALKKFGQSIDDAPGPNPTTTIITEEIFMQFLSSKEDDQLASMEGDGQEQDGMSKLKSTGKNLVQCRFCGMDHWSLKCPYKDKLGDMKLDTSVAGGSSGIDSKGDGLSSMEDRKGGAGGMAGGSKYVPPSMREGGSKRGDSMSNSKTKDEANTIRVTNLPEEIQDQDLKELFNPFGRVTRIFLAKDKYTGQSKGFAFVSYERREDAARAIRDVHGHGYANLILNVEWAKPSNN